MPSNSRKHQVRESVLRVPTGKTLSIVAGGIEIVRALLDFSSLRAGGFRSRAWLQREKSCSAL
jgi:hypothetical protein